MALKRPVSQGTIIESSSDPAQDASYVINARSIWLNTGVSPAVLYERNSTNTAWLPLFPFFGTQTDTFTATENQTAFTLSHTVTGGLDSIITFYDAGGRGDFVLQESGICTGLTGTSLTVTSGLVAGDKVMFVYPRSN